MTDGLHPHHVHADTQRVWPLNDSPPHTSLTINHHMIDEK